MAEIHTIPVRTEQELWFLEKQINVFDFLEYFPASAVANQSQKGDLLEFETDLGWSFKTDIEAKTFVLRQKSKNQPGTGKWVKESGLQPGDNICIEKLSSHKFRLYKC
jgi:hypothetical protein